MLKHTAGTGATSRWHCPACHPCVVVWCFCQALLIVVCTFSCFHVVMALAENHRLHVDDVRASWSPKPFKPCKPN